MARPPGPDAHWRDSARPIRFFIWDGKAAFPLVAVLMFPRWWTLIIAVICMMFFSLLNKYGLTVSVFLRWIRSWLAGPRKQARPWWRD